MTESGKKNKRSSYNLKGSQKDQFILSLQHKRFHKINVP